MTAANGSSTDPEALPWPIAPGLALAGVLAVVALVFAQTLGFRFVYDDGWTLVSNGFLRVPDLGVLLGPKAVARNVPDAFRPVQVLSDIVLYREFGLNAPLFHAVSLGLHLTVCLLVERWLRGLGAPILLRLATVALFGVSAVHAESVAVVSFREDLLAAALGLSALLAADRIVQAHTLAGRAAWGGGAASLMLLACGAKMSAAPLPVLWWLGRGLSPWREPTPLRQRIPGGFALALGVAIAIAHRLWLHGGLDPGAAGDPAVLAYRVGLGPVLAQSLQIHLTYLQQMVVPWGLSPEVVDRGASFSDLPTVLAGAGLAGLLALGVAGAARRRRPLVALAILGAFALALPTSNLFPLRNMAAARYLYLSSVPVYLGLAAVCLHSGLALARWDRRASPVLRFVPIAALVVIHGAMALTTARTYRAEGPLWASALARAPGSSRAHAVTGLLELSRLRRAHRVTDPGLLPRIRGRCQNAIRLDPQDPLAHLCRARLAAFERRWDDAYREFGRALALRGVPPDRLEAGLAQVGLDLGRRPLANGSGTTDPVREATMRIARALREYPYSADLHAVAAQIHHRLGNPARAKALYQRARILRPERWELAAWGLELAMDLGDTPAAEVAWRRDEPLLRAAESPIRRALATRFSDANRLFPIVPQTPPDRPENPP